MNGAKPMKRWSSRMRLFALVIAQCTCWLFVASPTTTSGQVMESNSGQCSWPLSRLTATLKVWSPPYTDTDLVPLYHIFNITLELNGQFDDVAWITPTGRVLEPSRVSRVVVTTRPDDPCYRKWFMTVSNLTSDDNGFWNATVSQTDGSSRNISSTTPLLACSNEYNRCNSSWGSRYECLNGGECYLVYKYGLCYPDEDRPYRDVYFIRPPCQHPAVFCACPPGFRGHYCEYDCSEVKRKSSGLSYDVTVNKGCPLNITMPDCGKNSNEDGHWLDTGTRTLHLQLANASLDHSGMFACSNGYKLNLHVAYAPSYALNTLQSCTETYETNDPDQASCPIHPGFPTGKYTWDIVDPGDGACYNEDTSQPLPSLDGEMIYTKDLLPGPLNKCKGKLMQAHNDANFPLECVDYTACYRCTLYTDTSLANYPNLTVDFLYKARRRSVAPTQEPTQLMVTSADGVCGDAGFPCQNKKSSSPLSTLGIVGISIGGSVLLALAAAVAVGVHRRRNQRRHQYGYKMADTGVDDDNAECDGDEEALTWQRLAPLSEFLVAEWKLFLAEIGLKEHQITTCELDHPISTRNQTEAALRMWHREVRPQRREPWTVGEMMKLLIKDGNRSIAELWAQKIGYTVKTTGIEFKDLADISDVVNEIKNSLPPAIDAPDYGLKNPCQKHACIIMYIA